MEREPEIYMPEEAATAVSPEGKKMVFFTVPQLDLLIKQVLAARPKSYTYRWAYHAGQKVHVLLVEWSSGQSAGLAIPEGPGDLILHFLLGTTDLYITVEPVEEKLKGSVSGETIAALVYGSTVALPGVKFKPEA
jgi:hypothetical protein